MWDGSYEGFATGLSLAAGDLDWDGYLDLIGGLSNGGIIGLRDSSGGRPTGLTATGKGHPTRMECERESRIRGYYIYRALTAAGVWNKLLPGYVPQPSYLDPTVTPSTRSLLLHNRPSRF